MLRETVGRPLFVAAVSAIPGFVGLPAPLPLGPDPGSTGPEGVNIFAVSLDLRIEVLILRFAIRKSRYELIQLLPGLLSNVVVPSSGIYIISDVELEVLRPINL